MESLPVARADVALPSCTGLLASCLPLLGLGGVTLEVVRDKVLYSLAQVRDDVVGLDGRLVLGGSSRGGALLLLLGLGGSGSCGPSILEGRPLGLLHGSGVSGILGEVLKR